MNVPSTAQAQRLPSAPSSSVQIQPSGAIRLGGSSSSAAADSSARTSNVPAQLVACSRYLRALRDFAAEGLEGGVSGLVGSVRALYEATGGAQRFHGGWQPEIDTVRQSELDCVLHLARLHASGATREDMLARAAAIDDSLERLGFGGRSEALACRTAADPRHAFDYEDHPALHSLDAAARTAKTLALLAAACDIRFGATPAAMKAALDCSNERPGISKGQKLMDGLLLARLRPAQVDAANFSALHMALIRSLGAKTPGGPDAATVRAFYGALATGLPQTLADKPAEAKALMAVLARHTDYVLALEAHPLSKDVLDGLAALHRAAQGFTGEGKDKKDSVLGKG